MRWVKECWQVLSCILFHFFVKYIRLTDASTVQHRVWCCCCWRGVVNYVINHSCGEFFSNGLDGRVGLLPQQCVLIKWWLSWSKLYTDDASGHKRCLAHAQPAYSPINHCLFSYELSWIILVVAEFLSLVCVWPHKFLSFLMQNDLSNRKNNYSVQAEYVLCSQNCI